MIKNLTRSRSAFFLICGLAPAMVLAQEGAALPEFTIGLKAWDASWASYFPGSVSAFTANGTPSDVQTINMLEGNRRVEILPTLSVRYGQYFLSTGFARFRSNFYTPETSIAASQTLNVSSSRTDRVTRRELDINAGYFVLPNLAFTVGYKGGLEDRDTSLGIRPGVSGNLFETRVNALLLGALGSFEIAPNLSAYGQFVYGFGRETTTVGDAFGPDNAGRKLRGNVRYIINEVGLAYRLPYESNLFQRTSVALGYRSQTLKTKAPLLTSGTVELRDVRDGVTLSFNVTF